MRRLGRLWGPTPTRFAQVLQPQPRQAIFALKGVAASSSAPTGGEDVLTLLKRVVTEIGNVREELGGLASKEALAELSRSMQRQTSVSNSRTGRLYEMWLRDSPAMAHRFSGSFRRSVDVNNLADLIALSTTHNDSRRDHHHGGYLTSSAAVCAAVLPALPALVHSLVSSLCNMPREKAGVAADLQRKFAVTGGADNPLASALERLRRHSTGGDSTPPEAKSWLRDVPDIVTVVDGVLDSERLAKLRHAMRRAPTAADDEAVEEAAVAQPSDDVDGKGVGGVKGVTPPRPDSSVPSALHRLYDLRTLSEAIKGGDEPALLDAMLHSPAGLVLLTYVVGGLRATASRIQLDMAGGVTETPTKDTIVVNIVVGEVKSGTSLNTRSIAMSGLRALEACALAHHASAHHSVGRGAGMLQLRDGHRCPQTRMTYVLRLDLHLAELTQGQADALAMDVAEEMRTLAHARDWSSSTRGEGVADSWPLPWADYTALNAFGHDAGCMVEVDVRATAWK